MAKKRLLLCSAIVLMGFLDWLTTIVGLSFGASEANPLLSGLTQSSMLIFSFAKLSAVGIIGCVFYKAMGSYLGPAPCLTSRFMYSGYAVSLFTLTALVANNLTVIMKLL